jgi:hypothetical protein
MWRQKGSLLFRPASVTWKRFCVVAGLWFALTTVLTLLCDGGIRRIDHHRLVRWAGSVPISVDPIFRCPASSRTDWILFFMIFAKQGNWGLQQRQSYLATKKSVAVIGQLRCWAQGWPKWSLTQHVTVQVKCDQPWHAQIQRGRT